MQLKLPELGEGVHEGELVKWRVKPGDTVKDDQPICDIMTDKATVELPSPFHGKVTELLAKEGDTIKVGQAVLSYEDGKGAAKTAEKPAAETKPAPTKPAAAPSAPAPMTMAPASTPVSIGGPVTAAPSTRRLAREVGVDLSQVRGSGPDGRIMKEDVERMIGAGATAAGPATIARGPAPTIPLPTRAPARPAGGEERVPFRGLRKKIAEKMRQSKDHATHFTYVEEADVTALVGLRSTAKEIGAKYGVKVTYLPFIFKAMVAALQKYPILNSSLDEEKQELVYKHYYNISLSVQTDDGLSAPVIKDVANKSILQIAKDIQDVSERARAKRLTLDDFQGGTITVTNAGTIGGHFATPIINYPEVAILGFNKIFRKPVVQETNGAEQIVIRDWTYFSISLDHRVVDGAVGAEFMKLFISYIENPAALLLESALMQP